MDWILHFVLLFDPFGHFVDPRIKNSTSIYVRFCNMYIVAASVERNRRREQERLQFRVYSIRNNQASKESSQNQQK